MTEPTDARRDEDTRAPPGLLAPLLPRGEPVEALLRKAQYFAPGEPSADYREVHRQGGRRAEEFYRDRWRHDREVRSTHGVNCTGSCSWKVYVKDGIITWETQQTDYPSVGPDSPEYEPRYDQFGWTSRSTQLQERRLLKWGAPLFHYATFAAIAGHVIGILIPRSVTEAIGIPERAYTLFSGIAGSVAALGVLFGAGVLVFRRTTVPRVRATTSGVDYLALILLGIIAILGIYLTLGVQQLGGGYDYRSTVSVWFRSLFTGRPDVAAISAAPVMYQVHATAAWMIFAVWPFSRLVHAWSYPIGYLWRPYVVYRDRRAGRPSEPGTGGRRWRRIGVRY